MTKNKQTNKQPGGYMESNLTEAEDITKRWQEYTEDPYKKKKRC